MPLAPQPVPVFPAGLAPQDADFTTLITNPFTFQTSGIVFRAERHGSQSLASGSTVIQYDTILEDPYSGWSGVNWRWTVPYTGQYEAVTTGCVSIAAFSSCAANIVTPYGTLDGAQHEALVAFPGMASGQQVISMVGGIDWFSGSIFVSTATTTNTVAGRFSSLEIRYLST